MKQFIKIGERIQYIGDSKFRSTKWPEGAWIENGILGTVTEYHPEEPEVILPGETFEAIPAYAVVKFDNGAETCIDPEEENTRWRKYFP